MKLVKLPLVNHNSVCALVLRAFFFLSTSLTCALEVGIIAPFYETQTPEAWHSSFLDAIDEQSASEIVLFRSINAIRLSFDYKDLIQKTRGQESTISTEADFVISWVFHSLVYENENDFYDSQIIYNKLSIKGALVIFDTKSRHLVENIEFDTHKKSREELPMLIDEIVQDLKFEFRKIINEFLSEQYLFPTSEKFGPFVKLHAGLVDGLKLSGYLSNEEGGLVQIVALNEKYSWAQVIKTSASKEDDRYAPLSIHDFQFNVSAGVVVLQEADKTWHAGFDLHLQLTFPTSPFIKPYVSSAFVFYNSSNKEFVVPIILTTGAMGSFGWQLLNISSFLGLGVSFSPNSSNTLEADSFVCEFGGKVSLVLASQIRLFIDGGYRFMLREKLFDAWGFSLSAPFVHAGLSIIF